MFKKSAIVTAIGLAVSVASQAQETPIATGDKYVDTYRWEVGGHYQAGEIQAGNFPDTDVDSFQVYGSYYFDPVDTTKGPRGEAAFLDHASNVTLAYAYREIDDNGIDVDGDYYDAAIRYVTDDAGWIFAGSYSRNEPINAEVDVYSLSAGKYITDNTTLLISYVDGDVDEGGDTDGWNLGLEHFWSFSNSGGIKLEGNAGFINVDDADDVDVYNLTGTWYITQDLGIGAGYGNFDGGGDELEQFNVFAEWFITRNIAVNAEYTNGELDETDLEVDSISIGARLRL